jgi:hypothetical protein
LSFLAEAQPRLENRRGQKALFGTLNFLGDRRNYKAKDIIGKITNLFCIYLFIFYSFCYKLANQTRNLLFAIQLLICIIYSERTIISFVGFVANLLNRPTDGATVSVRKRVTFRPLVST